VNTTAPDHHFTGYACNCGTSSARPAGMFQLAATESLYCG
jgi:hypothetical protein